MNTLHTLFDWLLAASLRASVLTLVVGMVQFLLRRHLSPRWRYALWFPVLAVLLMPVLPESRWSLESVLQKKPQVVEIAPVPVIAQAMQASPPLITATPVPVPIDWQQVSLITWAAGAALVLLIGSFSFMRALWRFQRTRQSVSAEFQAQLEEVAHDVGLRRAPRLLIAPTVNSPAVTGMLRPVLLLPSGFEQDFTPEEARLILQHELMHLKRGDLLLNTWLCVLMALHWFNPLLWLAFFKVRADREAACDAQVLENATPQRRSEYGHALLKIESSSAPFGLGLGFIGVLQRHASLRARIHSIAAPTRTRPFTGVLATVCIAGMTFLGITRAEKPSDKEPAQASSKLIGLETKIISFDRPSDWNLGGRLAAPPDAIDPPAKALELQMETLSEQELGKLLAETAKQPGANITAYPRMVTRDGKQVSIRSVVNQPVPSGQVDKTGKQGIQYLPIGFVGNFTAKQMPGDKISLDFDIIDSHIIGETKLAGQPYPIARSTVYGAPVELPLGTSTVVYGWEEPAWQDGKRQKVRPVMFVITPSLIDATLDLSGKSSADSPAAVPPAAEAPGGKIILPGVQFREASLKDTLAFIRHAALQNDPAKQGVNISLKGDGGTAKITLDLKNIPVSEALRYCAELAGHQLSVVEGGYVLAPAAAKVEAPLKTSNVLPDAAAQEAAAALRRAKPQHYDFAKANLGDLIRFLATDAGIRFISLPEDDPVGQRLVTFSLRSSPFEALEKICGVNGLILLLEKDVWYVRAADVSALVRKDYPRPGTRIPIKMLLDDLRDIMDAPISDTQPQQLPQHSASFKEDENVVHVVATRVQHTWVAGYLDAVNNGEKRRKERVVRLQSDRISSDTPLGTTTYSGKVTGTVGEITVQAEKVVYEPKACLLLLYPPYTFTQDGKKVVSKEGDVETHTITTADPS